MASRFPIKVIFGKETREKLLEGINTVANAVGQTLGPKGRNVAINQAYGVPSIIHDGVSVAKKIDLKDEFADMGAQLLKEAAIKTNVVAGDGTTTATLLAQALINRGLEDIAAGKNPMTLKAELENALQIALRELKKLSREIKGREEVERVATISSVDPKIGKIIAEAIDKTGKDGVITVEQGKGFETEIEYKEGLEFDRGYLSPYFVTDNERVEAVIEDANILITNIKINHNYQLVPFLENFITKWKLNNLVIIGETIDEALATLVVNKVKSGGLFKVLACQPPAFGDRQIDELEDIATLVGGVLVTDDSGRELKSVIPEELGHADKITADRDKTTIQGGRGNKKAIQARIKELQKQIEIANTEYDAGIKKERLAKLAGGVAIVKVGGITEAELADRKERVIDAKNAAKASMDEGIVAGGQAALLAISQKNVWPDTLGAKILREAIKQPFKTLMENAGLDYAEALGRITPLKYPYAIDVMDGQKKNMIEAGVIDPTKVIRSALENAVSIAGMTYTTNVMISEKYEESETK